MQLSILEYDPPAEHQAPPAPLPKPTPPAKPEPPFAISDAVRSLPYTNQKGETSTAFSDYVGIVLSVDCDRSRCLIHFGVPNHPCDVAWQYIEKADDPIRLWPTPPDKPSYTCWQEWKRCDDGGKWIYTGTMGLSPLKNRRENTELFPSGIDPNICHIRCYNHNTSKTA